MKWGIRKKPTKRELKARRERQKIADKRRQLSDEDLKRYVERLSNEKKLKTLVDEDLNPGRTFVKSLMTDTGKKTVSTLVASGVAGGAMYALRLAVKSGFKKDKMKEEFDKDSLADSIHRGGKPKK